jgi:ubiquinone/menaquinone biosynthesis C-methylase UbiE
MDTTDADDRIIKLHLGAGKYHWPCGWDNLDEETDLKALPYLDNSVDEIQAIHLFEHFHRTDVEAYLAEWHRVLRPQGRLVMEMPSLDKIARLIVGGETNIRLTMFGLFGDPREASPLMLHKWAWSNAELESVLTEAGFAVEFEKPVFHIEKRDLRIVGRKI